MEQLKQLVLQYIDKGKEYYTDTEDKQKVGIINLFNLLLILVFLPIMSVFSIAFEDFSKLMVNIFLFSMFLFVSYFNRNGKHHLAHIIAMVGSIISTYIIVFTAKEQDAAPFVNILIAVASVLMINHLLIRRIVVLLALGSFFITNYYNAKNLPLIDEKYLEYIVLLGLFYAVITYWDFQNKKYKSIILKKSNALAETNKTIKQQTEALIEAEKEKNKLLLFNKQKDMDTILTNHAMQLRMKENFIQRLKDALGNQDADREIRSIIIDLQSQAETQRKLNLLSQNMSEVNTALYERLLVNHPNLTKSEMEMCAFLRLGLTTKEIALLKSITENSVIVLKTRLRKKINLSTNTELSPYLLKT